MNITERMGKRRETGLDEIKRNARIALQDVDLQALYEAADLAELKDNGAVDAAVKAVLADRLVENLSKAKHYAKKAKLDRVGASAIIIAAKPSKW